MSIALRNTLLLVAAALLAVTAVAQSVPSGHAAARPVHHYVFFAEERERISEPSFLKTKAFEGAQIKYTWRELEPQKDQYDFGDIEHDLAYLQAKGKRLFIQLQDSSFDVKILPFPRYLLQDPAYHGGADKQINETDNAPDGSMSRRWDKSVQERYQRLLLALGREFDGRIEGINLPETAIDLGVDQRLWPKGFTPEIYCQAIVANLVALKRAFPKSVTLEYANFMPGDKRYLERVCQRAQELKVGLGGPDLLPYRPAQMWSSYPLIRRYAGSVPTGIAVQDGNYEDKDRTTGRQVTIADLLSFATEYLGVDYVFWCTQEPYFSQQLVPFLQHDAQRP